MRAVSRRFRFRVLLPLLLVGLAVGWLSLDRYNLGRARAEWMKVTLDQLAGLSLTNEGILSELETLKKSPDPDEPQRWTGRRVLLMRNGDYLVYAFRHGFNTGFVAHLFIARGSDGRWHYSTYHFCNEMVMLLPDEPPGSLAEFASRYAVREFDGKSDVCLQNTEP